MLSQSMQLVIPPAPKVHPKDLPAWRHLPMALSNSIGIFPDYAFEVPVASRTLLGIDAVLVNDPAGIRHVLAAHAANYVRPTIMTRLLRPLLGQGIFLSEGPEWRRQRRTLSPAFTPHNVGLLIPHFIGAAEDLLRGLERSSTADLSKAFQDGTLEAVLRALFSLPDSSQRAKFGAMVRDYLGGPGRASILDVLAPKETSFAFMAGRRQAFQKAWFAAADELIAGRWRSLHDGQHQDFLDLLLAASDADTNEALSSEEIRDQCASLLFGGFETTARLLFWACYLLTSILLSRSGCAARLQNSRRSGSQRSTISNTGRGCA